MPQTDTKDLTTYTNRDLILILHTKVDSISDSITDHETRLRAEEKVSNQMQGSITGIKWVGGFISLALAIVSFFGYRNN